MYTCSSTDTDCGRGYSISPQEAFEQYSDMVWRLALSRTGSAHYADDILQDVFVSLLRSKPLFESGEHCKAWLLRVTVNCSVNLLKSAWIRKFSSLDERLPLQSDDELVVYPSVLKLPEKQRVAIHLHYYEGYSVDEIARICDCKPSTVKSRLMRARNQLRVILKGEDFDV